MQDNKAAAECAHEYNIVYNIAPEYNRYMLIKFHIYIIIAWKN